MRLEAFHRSHAQSAVVMDALRRAAHSDDRVSPWLWRLKERPKQFKRRVLRADDDILIEGFPRSGNTFFYYSFWLSQKSRAKPLRIGGHFHLPFQFFLAQRWHIPAVLLLRPPVPTVLSYLVFLNGTIDLGRALARYTHFHETAARAAGSYVVVPFGEATSDPGGALARIDQRFGTDFALTADRDLTRKATIEAIERDRLGRIERGITDRQTSDLQQTTPSAAKDEARERYQAQLAAGAHKDWLYRAERIHERLLTQA